MRMGGTQEYLGYIVNGAAKMQSLIKDLLDLSRIGNNSEFQPVNLQMVLQSVLANLDTSIKQCGAKINAGFLPVVRGNDNELKRLFQNLISNAIKFRQKNVPLVIISLLSKIKLSGSSRSRTTASALKKNTGRKSSLFSSGCIR